MSEPARPGQVYEVDVELWPTSVCLPAGYRVALTVAGRDFARAGSEEPFHGSGPFRHDDPAARTAAAATQVIRVHSGEGTPTSLLLPVIP